MANATDKFCNQAATFPLDTLDKVDEFRSNLSKLIEWETIGIFSDEGNKNTVIMLIQDDVIVGSLRFCLTSPVVSTAISRLQGSADLIIYRNIQGHRITSTDLSTLDSINNLWASASNQSIELKVAGVTALFERFESERKVIGRGAGFKTATKNAVLRDSHGRCMFTGCGENLEYDELTGVIGNYSYLAHNVASSEQGARGIKLLSEKLSDVPENVLLLCDKHHRLIDKVASSDYTASALSKMRIEFCEVANSLLDGLKNEPIPVYAILWPVNSQTVSTPTKLQIANSLSILKSRMHGQLNTLSDNEELLCKSPDILWQAMPSIIVNSADTIIQQIKSNGYKAALFGFGPTSALIGLGAKIGNKNSVVPMLRYRDSGQWSWPNNLASGKFYKIEGLEGLTKSTDFVINIVLTAEPESLLTASEIVCAENNAQTITIRANSYSMGNGAIPHPDDGIAFTAELQSILHKLQSELGAKTIHLFACASNAASVFIGQAYDTHHPEVIVYDFDDNTMVPRLRLRSENHVCHIST
jgi:hypothetical protein